MNQIPLHFDISDIEHKRDVSVQVVIPRRRNRRSRCNGRAVQTDKEQVEEGLCDYDVDEKNIVTTKASMPHDGFGNAGSRGVFAFLT